jgi:hypothetical protein
MVRERFVVGRRVWWRFLYADGKRMMQTVLTIAGFDPSSGAGVTADLMVFAAHWLFGTSCITSLTVQSTVGVQASTPVSAETVRATLDCLESDLPAEGIKIGMLATAGNVAAVAEFLERLRGHGVRIPVVLDPVMRSSSGRELLDAEGVGVLRERLLLLVDWVTPNLEELGILAGRIVMQRGDGVERGGDGRAPEPAGRSADAGWRGDELAARGADCEPVDAWDRMCVFECAVESPRVWGCAVGRGGDGEAICCGGDSNG